MGKAMTVPQPLCSMLTTRLNYKNLSQSRTTTDGDSVRLVIESLVKTQSNLNYT